MMNSDFQRQEMDAVLWREKKIESRRVDGIALRLPTTGDTKALQEAADEYYTQAASELKLIVAGLGAMRTVPRVAKINEQYYAKLQKMGAVGDILYHFFRADGSPIAPDPASGIFPFTIQRLREFIKAGKRVVVLAGGMEKVEALRNALRAPVEARFFTDLVTDEIAARELVGRD